MVWGCCPPPPRGGHRGWWHEGREEWEGCEAYCGVSLSQLCTMENFWNQSLNQASWTCRPCPPSLLQGREVESYSPLVLKLQHASKLGNLLTVQSTRFIARPSGLPFCRWGTLRLSKGKDLPKVKQWMNGTWLLDTGPSALSLDPHLVLP